MDTLTFNIISSFEENGYTSYELSLEGYSRTIGIKMGSTAIFPISIEAFGKLKAKADAERIADLEARLAELQSAKA